MMPEIITLAIVVLLLLARELMERYRRKHPPATANPHTDNYRAGDMSVSYWTSHFDRIHEEVKESRVLGNKALNELTEIKTILKERHV